MNLTQIISISDVKRYSLLAIIGQINCKFAEKIEEIFVFSIFLCIFAAEIIHNRYECNCN